MNAEERIKAEIIYEAMAKKVVTQSHRKQMAQHVSAVETSAYVLPVNCLSSAKVVIAISLN